MKDVHEIFSIHVQKTNISGG